ncbi:helix-turn-helix domain-containing protein [Nonomuraea africana]|uniref:DNA-binding transcriptional MerR regulator n=1 Tax=Nonomuraea africana TaxID=46171 RepID=A0ABR9KHT2_9ACTN|nr:helix-turn-helix domain-containing protein [Nonomuraea africana]MBE1561571.1 DNA-binding transcriptional MerR regulator [Nonomuraea africana]
MSETWTIGELAERAAGLLRASGQQVNGRVREVPSERLIRWYATIGLLDPPLTRRGRVALYGRRHLLQLLAIKRMQAEGSSIAEIQIALAGATDTMLANAAHVHTTHPPTATPGATDPSIPHPAAADTADISTPHPAAADTPETSTPHPVTLSAPDALASEVVTAHSSDNSVLQFAVLGSALPPTAAPPTRAPETTAHGCSPEAGATAGAMRAEGLQGVGTTVPGREAGDVEAGGSAGPDVVWPGEGARPRFWARRAESPSWPLHGVRLAQGVTLLIDGAGRTPTEDDLEAVLAAAGPLLAVLEERRLHEGSAT